MALAVRYRRMTRPYEFEQRGQDFVGGYLLLEITIPSDLGHPRETFRAISKSSCEPSIALAFRLRRAKRFRASATTLKFRACADASCEAVTPREFIDSDFNLSGSDPVVANRAR